MLCRNPCCCLFGLVNSKNTANHKDGLTPSTHQQLVFKGLRVLNGRVSKQDADVDGGCCKLCKNNLPCRDGFIELPLPGRGGEGRASPWKRSVRPGSRRVVALITVVRTNRRRVRVCACGHVGVAAVHSELQPAVYHNIFLTIYFSHFANYVYRCFFCLYTEYLKGRSHSWWVVTGAGLEIEN